MNPLSSKLLNEETGAWTEILHPGISLFIFSRVTSDRGLNANLWNLCAESGNNQSLYYSILLQVTLEKINREMPGCSISVQAPVSSLKSLEESGFILDPNGIRVRGYKL